MNKSVSKTKLSVIILNFNSGNFLTECLESIFPSRLKNSVQIIIADNASTDNSLKLAQAVSNHNPKISTKFLRLKKNLGFSAGNNRGVKLINPSSEYVLFLNPDTTIDKNTLQKTINFFDQNSSAAAMTCKIILAKTGHLQPECHRGFPTPWRAFCYFSGLAHLFPKSKTFAGYFLGHLDTNTTHPIEACVGSFLAIRRQIGKSIGWWNEKYFFYGEDLDLCYKLYQKKYKLIFYPHCQIKHYQGVSSGIKKTTKNISTASRQTRIKIARASTQAMRIFYQDNLINQYPSFTHPLIMSGIKLLELARLFKANYL